MDDLIDSVHQLSASEYRAISCHFTQVFLH